MAGDAVHSETTGLTNEETAVTTKKLDVVGLRDIAKLLQVDGRTPTQWRGRGVLPPEDGFISETFPIWHRATILKWAAKTGRLPQQRAAAEAAEKAPAA